MTITESVWLLSEGQTRTAFAERAGITESCLYTLLSGKSQPRLTTFASMAKASVYSVEFDGTANIDTLDEFMLNRIFSDRKFYNITYDELSRLSGVPISTIHRADKRLVDPKLSTVLAMCKPLGFTVSINGEEII